MISIIVPIYNVDKYLNECINSILRQTYQDIEVLLIDDGSTDNSGVICDRYAKLDSRVKVYHKENGGMSDARNYGIRRASGNQITFVDSDDLIDRRMLEVLSELKCTNKCQMSVCARQLISEDGQIIQSSKSSPDSIIVSKSIEESLYSYFKSKIGGLVVWGKLYDRCLFDNIEFPVGKYNEDVYILYQIVSQCRSIVISSQQLYLYRVRAGSIMNRPFEDKHLDMIHASLTMHRFFEHNYPSITPFSGEILLHACINAALWMKRSRYQKEIGWNLVSSVIKSNKTLLMSKNISLRARIFAAALAIMPINFVKRIINMVN